MALPHEDLKHRLAEELGHPLDGRIWTDIVRFHSSLLDKIARGQTALDELERLYDLKEETYTTTSRRALARRRTQSLPGDARLRTLTRIAATYAASHNKGVRWVRENLLGGELLQPTEVAPWLQARAAEQSPSPAITISFSAADPAELLPPGPGRDFLDTLVRLGSVGPPEISSPLPLPWDREQCAAWLEGKAAEIRSGQSEPPDRGRLAERLYFWGGQSRPASKAFVSVGSSGPLYDLKLVACQLCDTVPFAGEADAVEFLLTGHTAALPAATMSARYSRLPALSRLELTIDPRLSSHEVAAFYQRGRAEFVRGRDKAMQDKHLELAVFCAEQLASEAHWGELQALWNERFPAWGYDPADRMARRFARDARAAFRRVVGQDLAEARAVLRDDSGVFMRRVGSITDEQMKGAP